MCNWYYTKLPDVNDDSSWNFMAHQPQTYVSTRAKISTKSIQFFYSFIFVRLNCLNFTEPTSWLLLMIRGSWVIQIHTAVTSNRKFFRDAPTYVRRYTAMQLDLSYKVRKAIYLGRVCGKVLPTLNELGGNTFSNDAIFHHKPSSSGNSGNESQRTFPPNGTSILFWIMKVQIGGENESFNPHLFRDYIWHIINNQ